MSYSEKLAQIDELRRKIDAVGKVPDDVLKKINYKFRLEWNYTSNSMEGNSLTRAETRSVMIGNITVQGKPLRDILEIKGHDDVITDIMSMGEGALGISEKRIKQIHAGIMSEEHPDKKNGIGKWKTANNYLYNNKGERIDFAPHEEAPALMHELTNRINAEREKIDRGVKDAMHPALLAFGFHLDFVTVHPFYDGNGRMARILTNIILIAYGFPPLYVKDNERLAYSQYLADIQVYGGDADLFFEFMSGLLLRSVQLKLDAIRGKDIT